MKLKSEILLLKILRWILEIFDPSGEINGLIGLDLLTSLHAVIDIDIPFIYLKKD